jgi:hypothetical protein
MLKNKKNLFFCLFVLRVLGLWTQGLRLLSRYNSTLNQNDFLAVLQSSEKKPADQEVSVRGYMLKALRRTAYEVISIFQTCHWQTLHPQTLQTLWRLCVHGVGVWKWFTCHCVASSAKHSQLYFWRLRRWH